MLRNTGISLSNSIKNSIRTFVYNCIESIDHFGKKWHFFHLRICFSTALALQQRKKYINLIELLLIFSYLPYSLNYYGDWAFISLYFQSDHWRCVGKLLNSAQLLCIQPPHCFLLLVLIVLWKSESIRFHRKEKRQVVEAGCMQDNEVWIRQVQLTVTMLYWAGDVLKVYRNTELEQRGRWGLNKMQESHTYM